ncbi:iron ABC transporter permease [Shinella zoogloeoides]|uniref:iron ABC transporter permease n=1 Tax=Shinella zoogloeoides TaxID=352475 RepID=UPI001FE1B934|nr:iron ABC transporter permease [Shinella zoogloeoides]
MTDARLPISRAMSGAVSGNGLWLTGLFLLLVLAVLDLRLGSSLIGWSDVLTFPQRPATLPQAILETVRAPRVAAAMLIGAALAVAGAVMQTTLRNPLAAPDILSVTSGAHLALVIATLLLPFQMPSLAATVLGGMAGAAACLTLGGGFRAPPVRLALAGVAISLSFSALASAIVLMADERASGLVLWSSGILDQTGWQKVATAGPAILAALALLLGTTRALDLLALGDDAARSLGMTRVTTLLGLAASVVLSGAAVALAGPVGFVGLAVPNLLRALGLIRHRCLLPLSALWGANVVLLADVTVQLLSTSGTVLPTGTVIACFGAPAMLVVLRVARTGAERRHRDPGLSKRLGGLSLAGGIAIAVPAILLAGLAFGDGLSLSPGEVLANLDLRAPRLLIALGAGAFLAAAGVLLQAVTRNPLCGPETVGLTQGAALFSLLALLAGLAPGSLPFQMVTAGGAFAALLLVLPFGLRRSPEKLVLAGVATAASLGAAGTLVVVEARLQTAEALSWLAGSTHGRGYEDALMLMPWLALLLFAAVAAARHLDTLALGDETARALGLASKGMRIVTIACAGLCVSVAVSSMGAVGFIGLLAPHAARLLTGPRHARLLPVAMILGALLLAMADIVGRSLIAPNELPAGLITALIGAPLFTLLLRPRSNGRASNR